MSKEIVFDSLEAYLAGLNEKGVAKIAFAEVNEKRAVQKDEQQIEVQQFIKIELLAYMDSVLYKYVITEGLTTESVDDLFDDLCSRGYDVTRRNRNII